MSRVDLITFCCPKDIHRLHERGALENLVYSHQYPFQSVVVVHQRCRGIERQPFGLSTHIVESEDYPDILSDFNLPEDDPKADDYTHGPAAPHYWKWHVINHLIGLTVSMADYIVFSDCDCTIKETDPIRSWVEEGVDILKRYPEVLIVSPSDGGFMAEARIPEARLTQNVSQQLFLCERQRLNDIDWNIPWDWEVIAPGGPMQEYYYMGEGRMWRFMHKHNLWRAILPDKWRYWHWQWH